MDSAIELEDFKDGIKDDLTDDQNKRLDEAIKQAHEGKVMDLDELKRRMTTWHLKK